MTEIPKTNEIYRHFKGNLYRIVTLATHSETGEQLVVYQALYGDYTVYARELSMFMGRVDREKYPDAQQEDRFVLLPQIVGQEASSAGEAQPPRESGAAQGAATQPPQGSGAAQGAVTQPPRESGAVQGAATQPLRESGAAQGAVTQPLQESSASQSAEAALDPFLLQFLDADTYREKLNLLAALHPRITDDMINTMAVSLDVEVNDGEIDERYEALKTCLLTMERYECSRLR